MPLLLQVFILVYLIAVASSTIDYHKLFAMTDNESALLVFEHPTLGVRFEYPFKLKDYLNLDYVKRTPSFPYIGSVSFILPSPNSTAFTNQSSSIHIDVSYCCSIFPRGKTFLQNITLDQYLNTLSKDNLIQSKSVTFAYNPGYELIYGNPVSQDAESMYVFTVAEGKLYSFVYESSPTDYQAYLPAVRHMIGSLEIIRK